MSPKFSERVDDQKRQECTQLLFKFLRHEFVLERPPGESYSLKLGVYESEDILLVYTRTRYNDKLVRALFDRVMMEVVAKVCLRAKIDPVDIAIDSTITKKI